MNINQSLLTLGRVICSLKEISLEDDPKKAAAKAKSTRIPYRDSKLTRVLQVGLLLKEAKETKWLYLSCYCNLLTLQQILCCSYCYYCTLSCRFEGV